MHIDEVDSDVFMVGRLLAAQFPQWAIYSWIEGENATVERITDPGQAATEVAHFITALQRIDPIGGPPPGAHNAQTRAAIASLHGRIDTEAATAAWETALQAPAWHSSPVWIHGDLQSGNLLAVQGRLTAVIDFGCLG